jgi:hypothetical protein
MVLVVQENNFNLEDTKMAKAPMKKKDKDGDWDNSKKKKC